jgi:hypothetical protein
LTRNCAIGYRLIPSFCSERLLSNVLAQV